MNASAGRGDEGITREILQETLWGRAAMLNLADSPFPMTPGPASPNGIQASPLQRTRVTRIGNEPPYTFNNLGWLTDGTNTEKGYAQEQEELVHVHIAPRPVWVRVT